MNASDTVDYVKICRDSGMSYQAIADELGITKPAARRIFETGKIGCNVAKTLNLDPTKKQLRDRARRAE